MTVAELIEKLSKYDKDLEIVGIRGSLELEYKQVTEVVENGGAISLTTRGWKDVLRIN
jgi:hypothetical protein